ncbi:MAG TPA: ATP-grasp domain-containing protein [Vicinamibacterales bacterium]
MVILIADRPTGQVRAFEAAASRLGLPSAVFLAAGASLQSDEGVNMLSGEDEMRAADELLQTVGERSPAGVIALGDRTARIAAVVARRSDIPWHAAEGVRNAIDPLLARGRLLAAGLPTPWFVTLPPGGTLAQIADRIRFPCIVRALDRGGASRPVRVNDPAALEAAIDIVGADHRTDRASMTEEPRQGGRELLIEAFVPGREVSIEGVLEDGALRVLAIFDRIDVAEGGRKGVIDVTPSALDGPSQRTVATAVVQTALALGLHHGPVHASCRFNERDLYVRRVAPWPVGDARAQLLRFASDARDDVTFEELLLRQATGQPIDGFGREPGAGGVLRMARAVRDRPSTPEEAGEVRVPSGNALTGAGAGAVLSIHRDGDEVAVVARAEGAAQVVRALRQAAAELRGKA